MSVIEAMRKPENLPPQYRNGIYDNSKTAIKQFVFVLNDSEKDGKFQEIADKVKKEFTAFEIKMSPTTEEAKEEKKLPDAWKDYLDIDLRHFDPNFTVRGMRFTTNDRTVASQVVRKLIEKELLPFAIMKIQGIEANVRKTRSGKINMIKGWFKESERTETDGLKQNFKMNRNELELRNLIDLAFVI
jgi:hypothetical protein